MRDAGECLKQRMERRGGRVCRIERREEKVPKKVGLRGNLGFGRKGVRVTSVFERRRLCDSLRKYWKPG